MSKRLIVLLIAGVVLVGGVIFMRATNVGAGVLWNWSNEGTWLLPLVGVSALIDSINPCAFSILLLTVAFLIGLKQTRGKILVLGGVYIVGIFTAYLLIGFGLLQVLHLFSTPHFVGKAAAWLLIALGAINLINEFFPRFPIKLRIPQGAHHAMARLLERTSLVALFGLGMLVGLCELPCTGGPYLMVVGLLHDSATFWPGFWYLVLYNLIFILPLIIVLLIASDKGLHEKVSAWQARERKPMRFWGGIAMVALGILVLLL